MTDYLITTEPGEHHALEISWTIDRSLVYISTNSRTIGMSPTMANELMNGLMAILKGDFSRAISETALAQEKFFADARQRRITEAAPRIERASPPTLENL